MRQLSPTTKHILKAFIPYTKSNLQLAFKPQVFFNELEKMGQGKKRSIKSAFYRAIKTGLIEIDDAGIPRLTKKGKLKIREYQPSKLSKNSHLLIIFDIPEDERVKRNHLRALLHELSFIKVQQSVWASKFDHREYLAAEIKEYGLENYVIIYEAAKLTIR